MSSFDLTELDLDDLTANEPLANTNVDGKGTLPDSSGDAIVAASGGSFGGRGPKSGALRPIVTPSTPSALGAGSPLLVKREAARQGSSSIVIQDEDSDVSA
jgi:hypothetical protein